jgi:formylglycine-generating enzyme required for sulfatase activity
MFGRRPSRSSRAYALSRLFISHSSKDNVSALAFKQWLGANGWPEEDVFLDVQNIGAGERWKDALRKANARCEAVVLLASPDALSSPECLAEVRKAEDFGKEIIVVLLRDVQFDDHRLDSYKERQIVDLAAPPAGHSEIVDYRGERCEVRFNEKALASVKDYLFKRGITPDHFPWPPQDKPNAEPFPGLSAFAEDDAGIFFGRDADILRGLDKLRVLRRNGRPRLLVIQSASGAGKSSYLRAGLWPRLDRDPDFAPLAILRPAQGILTGPEGLGRKLAPRLSQPGSPINAGDIHVRLMAHAADAAKAFLEYMALAAEQAHEERQISDQNARPPALVLAVDQAEELFAADDAAESQRFVFLLGKLVNDSPPGVEPFAIFTIRADGAARLFQMVADQQIELPESLPLLPLSPTSYRDVILKPLDVVARRGQQLTIEPLLASQLVADAAGADALPLLAFTLSLIYQEFGAGGTITLQQYQAMGGVSRSIDMALKRALAEPGNAPMIPVAKDEQLNYLRATFIPWLARIDPESGLPMRRVARIDEFPQDSRGIVQRLIKARLLVADRRSSADVVEVAHESLLRQWPALSEWLQADATDLKVVDAIERAAGEWMRNGRHDDWLDHRAERLRAAERVATREAFRKRLGDDGVAYLEACRRRETIELQEKKATRARDRQRRLAQALVAGLATMLLAGLFVWKFQQPLQNEVYRLRNVHSLTAEQEHSLASQATFNECSDCPNMVVVQAGSFKMGSPDLAHHKDEYPQHDVTFAQAFAVSQTELTFDQWDACASHGDCSSQISAGGWNRGQQPAINITWQDAERYVQWLSDVTGKKYRLLSEAEWEYAAGVTKPTLYFFGNDDSMLDQYGWYEVNANGQTHPVGGKAANPFGLKDMYGNVSEWVEDCYHDGYRGAPSDGSAWVTGDCSHRVVRGGDWLAHASSLRSTSRDWFNYDQRRDTTGLRVARTLAP